MGDTNPLGSLFLGATKKYDDKIAIRSVHQDFSYRELRTLVIKFALNLADRGVGAHSLVALDINGNVLHETIAVLALTLLGSPWLQADTEFKKQKSFSVTNILHDDPDRTDKPGLIYVDNTLYQAPQSYGDRRHFNFPGYASADDVWFLAKSSGTTGVSKYLPISSHNFYDRILSLCAVPEIHAPLVVSDVFRRGSNLACLHLLYTLHLGGTYILSGNGYAHLVSQGVKRLIASPAHLSRLLDGVAIPETPGISEVRVVGASIKPKLLSRLLQYFDLVTTTYGSTEAGPTTRRMFSEFDSDTSVGSFYPNVDLEVVDEKNQPVGPDVQGEIRVRTTGLIKEYVDHPEATKEAFREGWFYPGDKGYYSPDGKLYIVGRTKDHLNVSGIKLNAALIDQAIQDAEGVIDGMCFSETGENGIETLSALISFQPGFSVKEVVAAIRLGILAQENDKYRVPSKYYQVDKIPRNPNGKIMRHQANDLVSGLVAIAET